MIPITISGLTSAGSTTVSKKLCEVYGFKYFHHSIRDKTTDDDFKKSVEESLKGCNAVIDYKQAVLLFDTVQSISIYLDVPIEIRDQRLMASKCSFNYDIGCMLSQFDHEEIQYGKFFYGKDFSSQYLYKFNVSSMELNILDIINKVSLIVARNL